MTAALAPFLPALCAIAAYLVGSLSFAVIVSRAMGLSDPRTYGSGNPGATNVLRSGSKAAAILTLLLDALKGWCRSRSRCGSGRRTGSAKAPSRWWRSPPSSATSGRCSSASGRQGRRDGGRRVARHRPAARRGDARHLDHHRRVLPLLVARLARRCRVRAVLARATEGADAVAAALLVIAALLIWRHRANITRLLAGTESRIGRKAGPAKTAPKPRRAARP